VRINWASVGNTEEIFHDYLAEEMMWHRKSGGNESVSYGKF